MTIDLKASKLLGFRLAVVASTAKRGQKAAIARTGAKTGLKAGFKDALKTIGAKNGQKTA